MKIIEDSHVHPTVRQQFTDQELLELMQKHCVGKGVRVRTVDTDRIGLNNLLKRKEAMNRIYLGVRGSRRWASLVALMSGIPTTLLTLVVGPHGDDADVLYTAYWGTPAPREVNDPNLPREEADESLSFWSEHVLAVDEFDRTVINLSSHEIRIAGGEPGDDLILPRSRPVVEVSSTAAMAWWKMPGKPQKPVLGLNVELHAHQPVINDLPHPMRGVFFVVDKDVRWALRDERPDVLAVGRNYFSAHSGSVCTSWHSCHDYT